MLNILPKKKRHEVKLKKNFNNIKKIIIITFIIIIGTASLCLMEYLLLTQALNKTEDDLANYTQEENLLNAKEKIFLFNESLDKSQNIQKNHVNPVSIINNLAPLVSSDITIASLEISIEEKTIKINGTAKNRDKLLEFQNNLSNSDMFLNFSYPISNLAEKENINFDYTGEMNI